MTESDLYNIINKFNHSNEADTKHQLLIDFLKIFNKPNIRRHAKILKRFVLSNRNGVIVANDYLTDDDLIMIFKFDIRFINNSVIKYTEEYGRQYTDEVCFLNHKNTYINIYYTDMDYQNNIDIPIGSKRGYETICEPNLRYIKYIKT